MKALQISKAGTPDDLCVSELPCPDPGPGEVRVRVKAAALNHRDLHLFTWEPEQPFTLGSDGAGEIDALGAGVAGVAVGDPVVINPSLNWGPDESVSGPGWSILGWPTNGTLAEAVVVAAEQVAPKPAHLSWEEAAALPLAGLTAYRALVTRARLQAGETVLVHGIGGGVALFVLQFARVLGARVMVTSTSDEKLARAREFGAEAGVNSRTADWVAAAREWAGGLGVDVAVDSLGGDYLAQSLAALRRGGRLVNFGRTLSSSATIDVRALFWHELSLLGSTMGSPRDFAGLLALVSQHQLRPVIDKVFSLEDGCWAFQRLSQGQQFGKIVIRCE